MKIKPISKPVRIAYLLTMIVATFWYGYVKDQMVWAWFWLPIIVLCILDVIRVKIPKD